MTGQAVVVDGLTKDFGSFRAVDDVTFELPMGDVVGFVGPNGAGKSTNIRMLLGLIRPSSGTGYVFGYSIDDPPAYMDRVGALVESPTLYPQLSGRRNLQVLAHLAGLPSSRVDAVLEVVSLTDRAKDRFTDYSLGMKQRLGIAAALLQDPDLLILDEPTNGLDPAGTVDIRSLLRNLSAAGKTVLVSSHLLAEIQAACDRIVLIQRGRLLFSGAIDGLLEGSEERIIATPEHPADLDTIVRVCRDQGYQASQLNGSARIVAPPDWAAELNRTTAAAGVTLKELRPEVADLEEAFLQLTGTQAEVAS